VKDIKKRVERTNAGPRIVAAILVGSAVLLSAAPGQAQAPPAANSGADPTLPSSPPAPGPAGGTAADGSAASNPSSLPTSNGGGRTWSGPSSKAEGPKTFWETVWPTIVPYPRTGNFYVAPSGPGYYTLYDFLQGRELQNANPFFNVDFRYLDNPNNTESFLFDELKRIHLGDDWLFSTGGEFRDRYSSLDNAYLYNKKPQAGDNEDFNLIRTRLYGDLSYLDVFRLYGEFISADSSPQTIPHLSSDVDKADILNLFMEVKVLPIGDDALYVRGGRQELLFGSQRLISPSDWSNELRTFQGVRVLYHTDKIEEDAWWVQPVIVNSGKLDSVDDRQCFVGDYFKYRLNKDISLDAYYLYLDNDNQTASGRKGVLGGYDVNTLGSRFVGQAGDRSQYLFDFEGAVQFGDWSNQTTEADMYVAGVGYWFKDLPAIPTFWVYYDHASGTQDPTNGTEHRTFNQLFPSGHSYYNAEDLFGRQNINDFHLEAGIFPLDWLRFTAAYHVLSLDQAKDALYNSSGSVVRQDTTGKSGTDIGNALSGTVQFHLDNHQLVNITYAHLFSGTFIKETAVTPAAAKDQDSVWATYQLKW
jgi:alginate export protein